MTVIDDSGIRRLVRNRIPQIVDGDECIVLTKFSDAKGIGVLTEINGKARPFADRLPIEPSRDDVMNVIDRLSERIKLAGKFLI